MAVTPKVGSYVSSGSVTWKILAVKGSTALLLSKDILARMPYYLDYDAERRGYVDSIIRTWLNDTFLSSLPHEFRDRIITTKIELTERIKGFDYAQYGLEINSVEDKVFILSENEAKALFLNNASRVARLNLDYIRDSEPQSFAATSKEDRTYSEECDSWWLRTSNPDVYREVSADGTIDDSTAPLVASLFDIQRLDAELYKRMNHEPFVTLLNMVAAIYGIPGMKSSFVTALMGSRGYIGVRPALWLNFEQ